LKKEPKQPLGRGLDALIGERAALSEPGEGAQSWVTHELPIDSIAPSETQPRLDVSDTALEELSRSIAQHGLLQPIVVRPGPQVRERRYTLVAGERRWRAAKLAGSKTIPALIREVDDKTSLALALVENLQREDLSPLECARAYQMLAEDFGMTQDQVAEQIGRSRPVVANALRLLALPEEVQLALHEGRLSEGHARAILSIEGKEKQLLALQTILDSGLSVRKAETLAKTLKRKKVSRETPKAAEEQPDPNLVQLENALQMHFGTKVTIRRTAQKGVIEIEFYTDEDLERVLSLLRGPR
jgi:ParB family chromosome partitioning protein